MNRPSLYSRILENRLLPLHNAIRGRQYVRHRRFLEESQWWSADRLREFQWTELRKLLTLAFTSVPFYKRRYAEAGAALEDIRSWDDFAKLPVLVRADVERHREELSAENLASPRLPHATGGSSGRPVRFYKTIESYDWRTAATQRVYSWTGCRPGERTLYLWGAPVGKQHPLAVWKTRLYNAVHRTLIVPTFLQDDQIWRQAWEKAQSFQPRFMVGYVSSLVGFARYIERARLGPPPGLRSVISAAEPLTDSSRAYLRQVLQVPVFNTYGSREFMSIGGECERHEGVHLNVENLVVEAEQNPASPGNLLVTDLHNHATVFIRYAIGDTGRLAERPCSCGRGLPMLAAVDGPSLGVLRLTGGQSVSPILFRHVLKEIQEIIEYQVRQKAPDHVVVAAVLSAPLSERSQALFRSEMGKIFGPLRVDLEPVEEIERGPSGKVRPVITLPS